MVVTVRTSWPNWALEQRRGIIDTSNRDGRLSDRDVCVAADGICKITQVARIKAVIIHINSEREGDLMKIALTFSSLCGGLGFAEGWQQQSRQDPNYGNHHEQFDERKPYPSTYRFPRVCPPASLVGASRHTGTNHCICWGF